jgi:tetratricopeptide (TPR) repeat protein
MKKLLIITTLSLAAAFAMADETADPAQGSTPATKSVPARQSTPAVRSTPATPATPTKGNALQANNLYNEGTQALNESRWDDAMGKFDSVIKNGSGNTAGALYWKAYALKQLGRRSEAQQSVSELARRFPTSRWNKDAKVLMSSRSNGSIEPPTPPPTPDADDDEKERAREERERAQEDRERQREDRDRAREDRERERESREDKDSGCGENAEMKLLAINNLMNSGDQERALPVLEKLLNGNACKKMKDRALFVLAQSSSPRARQIMSNIAKGQQMPELQKSAINYLGIHGGDEGMKILEDLYKSGINVEAKKQILNSFGINGQRDKLLSVVKNEKEPALIRAAINGLGISGGCNELMQLYKSSSDYQTKVWVLDSFIVCGGSSQFADVARTESDPKLRIKAIHGIGISGGHNSGTLLGQIYDSNKDYDTRSAVLEGLFISGNSKALVDLAKKETDPKLKRRIVEKLSIMGDKEASDYMIQILEKD